MGMTAPILDANQQDRFVAHLTLAGIENRMRRIGPVTGGQMGLSPWRWNNSGP